MKQGKQYDAWNIRTVKPISSNMIIKTPQIWQKKIPFQSKCVFPCITNYEFIRLQDKFRNKIYMYRHNVEGAEKKKTSNKNLSMDY